MSTWVIRLIPVLVVLAKMSSCDTAGPVSPYLKFVASADGKSFFADDIRRNWTDSSIFCVSLGMQLATITSSTQWTALANAYSADFGSFYWTSGRDAHELRQFSWNASGSDVTGNYLPFVADHVSTVPYLTCLAFESYSNNNSLVYPRQCLIEMGAICETV